MSELMRRIVQASSHVEPTWSAEREARVRAGVGRGVRRRQRRGAIVIAGLGAGALVIGFVIGRQPGTTPRMALPDTSVQSVPQANLLQLPDGSSVQAGSPDARVETVEVGPTGVTLRLDSGTARFTVTPNAKRPFRVMARDVTVSVLGTVFSVGLEARAVRVGVERGRVRVDAVEGARELGVGETAAFESVAKAAAPERDPAAEAARTPVPLTDLSAMPSSEPAPRAAGQGGPSWRVLAKDQNYVTALARLMAEGPNAVHDTPEDLLLAADVARLGGRPDRAVSPLQRVIADHPFDPRAPLAAFTLGRTLLEQLGRPREAARAFATARRLDRGGTLTQDALAREVESWAGAGEAEQARERALEYTRLHPRGRRLAAVRRLGGLD